jgi:hypothetical protein
MTSGTETEPLGITYDRLRLADVQRRLVNRLSLSRVIEVDASGAKAKPSLYSLGFALAGCTVDLVGGRAESLEDWRALGLEDRVRLLSRPPRRGSWDVAFNFVTAASDPRFTARLSYMSRLAPLVMTVHVNGLHVGGPWHRLLHAVFRLPWTHGRFTAEFPGTVGLAYRTAGLSTRACGFFDAPGWPDPPGFRDVRLHRAGVSGHEEDVRWRAPIVDILGSGDVPTLLRVLEVQERLQPPPVRALMAHLYFHVGSR